MKNILTHFKTKDPIIFNLLETMSISTLSQKVQPKDFFYELTQSIIGQQLSIKVANVIIKRFEQLFDNHPITPESIFELEDQAMRNIGMSWSKVKYVKDLAKKTLNQEIDFEKISTLGSEEIISELTKVKGIGRWTAEMFLIFTLGREDIFSLGDLGLKRAIEKNYNLQKDTALHHVESLMKKWQPYRSYAALALWHSLDNKPKN